MEIETQLSSSQQVYSKFSESENELRAKIEDLMKRAHAKDVECRKKDEELFNLQREVQSLKSDCKNLSTIEQSFQAEMQDLIEKRRNLEDIN